MYDLFKQTNMPTISNNQILETRKQVVVRYRENDDRAGKLVGHYNLLFLF